MLRLWSQVARPQLSCTCISCSSSVVGVLARRPASATSRRRLKLVDAFTILLAPVLATAFVADAIRKDRRRIEWDRKIAAVEGEVQRLRNRESHLLRSLSSGFNARQKAMPHIRPYSTSVRSQLLEDDADEGLDVPQWRSVESEIQLEDDDVHDAFVGGAQEPSPFDLSKTENTEDACRRVEKLVALKLALRMLLHVQIGTSPRFKDMSPGYAYKATSHTEDLNGLIDKLNVIRRSLHNLNSAEERRRASAVRKMPRRGQAVIDREISHLAHDFKLGRLSVSRLVKMIGNSIARSPEPPSVKAYITLMTALSRARLDELAYLVMAAMDESRLTLSNHSVFSIIWQYGKNKDTNRFDQFLRSVTKPGAATKYSELWEWRTINEVQVPCPMSNDSRLLQILVYTALKCNQPHRAEAWLSQLSYSDGPPRYASHVLRNFMKFYATNRDWQRGGAWLLAGLDWSVNVERGAVRDLQRVVFAMLELCVACGKQEVYTSILQAAVHARIGVFAAETDLKFTDRSKSILAEWEKLHNSLPICPEDDSLSALSKAQHFCDEAIPKLKSLGLTQISSCFEWPTPASTGFQFRQGSSGFSSSTDDSAIEWRRLCQQQAAELEKVKAQLTKLEWLRSKVARSEVGEADTPAMVSIPNSVQTLRQQGKGSSLADALVNCAANSFTENLIPSSSQKETRVKSSTMSPTSSPKISQEVSMARSDVGDSNSDLEQKPSSVHTQAADSRWRRNTSSGLDDSARASTTSTACSYPNRKLEFANAHESLRSEGTVESVIRETSWHLDSRFQSASIQGDVLTELQPVAAATRNPDQETDRFENPHTDNPNSDTSDSPMDPFSSSLPLVSDALIPPLLSEAANEAVPRSSTPFSTGSADTAKDTADEQTVKTPTPARKGQWIGFLEMSRNRKLSARATLRYTHLGKPEPPKPAERSLQRLIGYNDRPLRPYIVLRLGQHPPLRAVKWVNGEFRLQEGGTEKAEACAVRMDTRPIYNGPG